MNIHIAEAEKHISRAAALVAAIIDQSDRIYPCGEQILVAERIENLLGLLEDEVASASSAIEDAKRDEM